MTLKPTLVFIATLALLAVVASAQDSSASSSPIAPQPPAASGPGSIPPSRPMHPPPQQQQQIMPDVFAIFSACSSDVERVCASMQPDTCLEQLRVLYTSLSDTCKTTLQHEFPCISDAATHCAHSQAGWPLMNCLASISAADVSPRCASWLDAVRAQWTGESEPAIAVLPAEPGYPHTGGAMPADEDDAATGSSDYYRPGDDEDSYHHGHHGGRHHWKKHHGKMFFALAFVALIAGAVGACCGMCCMRRRMMRGGEGCCRRSCGARCGGANRGAAVRMAPQFAGATNIPLHHVPSRGPMQYAVMSDEVVPASAV